MLAAATVVALVGAGCSSDDDDDDGASDTTDTTAELTGDPVVIATIGEFSAGVSSPEIPDGAQAAVDAVNRAGGINGGPLELVVCDTENDPNTAAECGRQVVDAGAVAVVSTLSVNQGEYYPALEEAQIPVVGNVPAGVGDFTSEFSFPISGGIVSASAGLAGALANGGAERIAIARVDLADAAVIQQFANQGLESYGQETVADIPVPEGSADLAPYVQAVLEADADGVLVGLPGVDATNFVIAMRQTEPDVQISMTATDIGGVFDALGAEAAGIYTNSIFVPQVLETEATEQFADDMEAAGYDDLSGFRKNAYVSVMVVAEQIASLPEITGAALKEALSTNASVDPAALAPPVNFTEGGIGGIPRVFNPCLMSMQANEDGESEPVSGTFYDAFTGEDCQQPPGV